MTSILSSGRVAALLGTSEPTLNDLIRRGKLSPAPSVIAGRRLWEREHVLAAAKALRISEYVILAKLGEVASGN